MKDLKNLINQKIIQSSCLFCSFSLSAAYPPQHGAPLVPVKRAHLCPQFLSFLDGADQMLMALTWVNSHQFSSMQE